MRLSGVISAVAAVAATLCGAPAFAAPEACQKPVYLTIDTGHMGVAPLIIDVLKRQHVKATFFLANERTQAVGDKAVGMTLDEQWAPWWKALAADGHDFGSHTWDHLIWRADEPKGFVLQPTAGPQTGQKLHLSPADYCEELAKPARRFEAMKDELRETAEAAR